MMQVVVPSRETVGEYLDLKQEIELLISRINGEYSTTGGSRFTGATARCLERSWPLSTVGRTWRS